ncbi:hypothetical protein EDB80DRAFT_714123 [Ilyonectria destructans]|nr:hypothetical protein EDB80DRAFT_714123 [Ilyonectria destructans]
MSRPNLQYPGIRVPFNPGGFMDWESTPAPEEDPQSTKASRPQKRPKTAGNQIQAPTRDQSPKRGGDVQLRAHRAISDGNRAEVDDLLDSALLDLPPLESAANDEFNIIDQPDTTSEPYCVGNSDADKAIQRINNIIESYAQPEHPVASTHPNQQHTDSSVHDTILNPIEEVVRIEDGDFPVICDDAVLPIREEDIGFDDSESDDTIGREEGL